MSINSIFQDLKSQIKSVPGGTVVGNGLRSIINKATGGAFGNGAMVIKNGETQDGMWKRIKDGFLTGLGSGANTAQDAMNNPLKAGVIMDKIKALFPKIISLMVMGAIALFTFKFLRKQTGFKSRPKI